MLRRPGALFLLPLAALGLLSTKLGGRMVMFGAPVVAVGLTLPLYWLLQRLVRPDLRGKGAGLLTSAVLIGLLVAPFVDMIQAMSQGPMINRRHAEALTRAQTMTPEDAVLWLWWDWATLRTISRGAPPLPTERSTPAPRSICLPRFSPRTMRALPGNCPLYQANPATNRGMSSKIWTVRRPRL